MEPNYLDYQLLRLELLEPAELSATVASVEIELTPGLLQEELCENCRKSWPGVCPEFGCAWIEDVSVPPDGPFYVPEEMAYAEPDALLLNQLFRFTPTVGDDTCCLT
jgi:hypothetical protein